ncbi:MAG TPA: mechanosensitive ion channel family protein [Gallionellaceae bacterium]
MAAPMKALLKTLGIDQSSEWVEFSEAALHILIILILSWLLLVISRKLIRTFRKYIANRTHDLGTIKRAETLGQVFTNVTTVIITLITGMLILSEMGISIAPILAAAGVVGVAVGFGAQSLIKDYFTGFFLLLEDQVRHGENVELGGKKGVVEEVTLRHVKLRDNDGSVHYIPNGIITTVSNQSRDYSYAVIDIGVAYREDVDTVYAAMNKIGKEMRGDPAWQDRIVEDLLIAGVQELADSAVIIRCRFKVQPLEDVNVRREFLYRVKKAFDQAGIEIPYPHLTVYAGQDKQGAAAPFVVQARVDQTGK